MYLLDEVKESGIDVSSLPEVCCSIFEENAATLEILKVPKVKPRTRHINVLYHHFRSEVQNNRAKIHPMKRMKIWLTYSQKSRWPFKFLDEEHNGTSLSNDMLGLLANMKINDKCPSVNVENDSNSNSNTTLENMEY